jgi:hypothetical protein
MTSDLNKARKIVSERESWIGPHGELREDIAEAIAAGIAMGRKEGLELARALILSEIDKIA